MSDASAEVRDFWNRTALDWDLQVGDEGDANRRLNSDPVPDLPGAVRAFHRVLRPGGAATVVFSHPCFPQGRRSDAPDGGTSYRWDFPYFERRRCVDPPWGHFRCDFV